MRIFAGISRCIQRKDFPNADGRHHRTAGNVFFALFAGIAMVGAVGWGFNTVLRGPIKGMTEVTNRTVAENTVITSSRLAIVGATTKQADGGDCDADGMIEPLPYRDAGASPHPAGGGYLPSGLAPSTIDPWKTEYGYCAWDAGSVSVSDANAGCGGATPRRLEGSPLNNQYAIVIISAGKDRKFQTSCNAYVDANADNKPDTALIVTPAGSDDVVLGYTYAEANNLGNGMWKPKTADPTTAQTDKNLDITGGGKFTGKVVMTGNTVTGGGLILPGDPGDDSLTGPCDAANDKQLRRNTSNIPATLEICDFTGGLGWTPISGGTSTGTTGTLITRWKFDETSGTTAADAVGNHDATLVNTPTWQSDSGVWNGDLSFDHSSSEYGQVTRDAALEPTAITVAAWVKRSGNPSTKGTIIQKTWGDAGSPTYASYALAINQTGNLIDFVTGHSSSSDTLQSVAAVPDGIWTHVVGVYDPRATSNQKRLYINGVMVSSKTLTNAIEYDKTTTGDLFIGSKAATGTGSLNGAVDEIRLYNYGLNDSEILALYMQSQTGVGNMKPPSRPGQIFTWGDDTDDALGNGANYASMDAPHHILGGDDFIQATQAATGGCGIKLGGSVWCWGLNDNGQIGNGTTTNAVSPVKVSNITDAIKVDVGRRHACAIQKTGKAWCWGKNSDGQLGNNSTIDSSIPVEVYGYTDYIDILASDQYSCGIRQNGEMWCWGQNGSGQLGNGTTTPSSIPVRVSTISNFVTMDAPARTTTVPRVCGVTKDGNGYCWGAQTSGEFGNGATSGSSTTPVLVSTLTDISEVATGQDTTCWLRAGGEIWCSGLDSAGMQGNNTGGNNTSPTRAMIYFDDYTDMAVSSNNVCAIRKNKELWCAGQDSSGQLGNGPDSTANSQVPVKVLTNVLDIHTSSARLGALVDSNSVLYSPPLDNNNRLSLERRGGCVIDALNQIACWGDNTYGQLGNGVVGGTYTSPVNNTDAGPWMQIDVSGAYNTNYGSACGIKYDGTLWCWGSDYKGQLGNGGTTTTDQGSPVKVSDDGPWSQVSGSQVHTCAIKTNGTAWCWGSDSFDALGATGSGDQDAPVQVTDVGPWTKLSAGGPSTCGIKSDKSLWCWGYNINGQLGDGTTVDKPDPVKVSEPGSWADVSVNGNSTCAIKTNGTMWCWGLAASIGLTGNTTIPRMIPDPGPWSKVSANILHACGIKADGSAWCWGTNTYGALGDGTTTTRNVPVRVLGTGIWTDIATGGTYSCGRKSDTSLWCWGDDTFGEQANGPAVTGVQNSPRRVPLFPRGEPWWWDSLGTSISAPYGANATIGTTAYISNDGASHGLNLQGSGRGQILDSVANELSITAANTSYSAQLHLKSLSAKTSTDVTTGLVSKWMLDSAAGTTVTASVGTSGTTTGTPTWLVSAGKLGNALAFNGTSQYASVARSAAIETAAVTVSLWIKRNGAQVAYAGIFSKTWSNGTSPSFASYGLQFNSDVLSGLRFVTGHSGTYDTLTMSTPVPDATWTHIVLTYDPSAPAPQKKIYMNGVLNASKTLTASLIYDTTATGNVFFAQNGCAAPCEYFKGALDDVRIYSRALDPGEVAQLYYYTSQDIITRTMGVDYNSGNLMIARNNDSVSSSLPSLKSDLEVTANGNVGIDVGSSAPSKLTVGGAVKFGNDAAACAAGKAGTIKWTGSAWKYCNGSAWKAWGSASGFIPWRGGSNRFTTRATACAIKGDGTAWCWGSASDGQLGNNNNTTPALLPVKLHDDASSTGWSDWIQLSNGWSHSCGIRANGTAWCWGERYFGRLGNNVTTTADVMRPLQVHSDSSSTGWTDWVQISAGGAHTCGIRAEGSAWCWGFGGDGEMGNGGTNSAYGRPVQVQTDTGPGAWSDWIQISTGASHTCGIRNNGTAWCWGEGISGKLGYGSLDVSPADGAVDSTTRPVQVLTDAGAAGWGDWINISAGSSVTCGIRANGTAWCWGNAGALGDNQNQTGGTAQNLPVQVHSDSSSTGWTDWLQVSVGFASNSATDHACGIRANGTAWCWGGAASVGGKLGNNVNIPKPRPVQVLDNSAGAGWTDWLQVSPAELHTCGLRANGTMWCWGQGAQGRLGDGSATDTLVPIQVQ